MAIYLEEKGLLFLQVPGTASSSLEDALLNQAGGRLVGQKHATLTELNLDEDASSAVQNSKSVICVVRNHFDWFYSEWYRCRTRWVYELDGSALTWGDAKRLEIKQACAFEFSPFLEWRLTEYDQSSETRSLFGHFTDSATTIFKMERLDEIQQWLEEKHQTPISLPRVNVTDKRAPYWQAYDRKARALVEHFYGEELKKFSYLF
ncbi:hypothetical protein [Acidocella aromatica]|uniref:Sulfotransferase family protein n=1 Tax=Acidocella aromatica TaxID=1303579 RepID=A0A840V9X4_9PROT|nr:hypothetical protein [Acidocella aromatica]MBB5372748.1 hypothetical protein [Acidocella aromatica]